MPLPKDRFCGECAKWWECKTGFMAEIERQDPACKDFIKDTPANHCRHCQRNYYGRAVDMLTCDRGGVVCLDCCRGCKARCKATEKNRLFNAVFRTLAESFHDAEKRKRPVEWSPSESIDPRWGDMYRSL